MSRIKPALIILLTIATGSVSTVISEFHKQNLSDRVGVSITGYGFPLSWYRESWIVFLIMPTPKGYSLHWEYLVLGIVFWSLIIAIPVAIASNWLRVRRNKH